MGKKKGGGRIQVFSRDTNIWRHINTIFIPREVKFKDYSGLDVRGNKFVVVSQSSSKLWMGELAQSKWEFVDSGQIYNFPRKKNGKKKYGNIEGVSWISEDKVVVVSDRRKTGDDEQPKRYEKKDQSIHIFKVPARNL